MNSIFKLVWCLFVFLSFNAFANAASVNYQISWMTNSCYVMEGGFSFDQSLQGAGVIHSDALKSFYIEGYLNGESIGGWDYFSDPLTGIFNFNFDTDTNKFLTGGSSISSTGQIWNTQQGGGCDSFGFSSGSYSQGLCVDGGYIHGVYLPESTLFAVQTVPVPAGISLFLSGLVGLGLMRGRNGYLINGL